MKLNRTGSIWDRNNRNGINDNWEMLDEFIGKWDGNQLLEWSYNLLNTDNMTPGTLNTNGEIVPSENSSVTEFIAFKPGTWLSVKPTGKLTQFYDKDFNYISGVQASETFPVLSPPGTAYIRLAILNSRIEETWIYEGRDDKPYKPYGVEASEKLYSAEFLREVNEQINIVQKLIDGQLNIEPYVNLLDKNAVTKDHSVNFLTGELVPNEGFFATERIRIIPGEKLMIAPSYGQSAFLDLDGNRVGGFGSSETMPVTIPDNAYYIITSGLMSDLDSRMVYLGTEPMEYKPFNQTDSKGDYTTNRLTFNSDGFPEITVPYDKDSNIDFTFGQLGINEIYHLRRAKTDYWNQLYSSDYISPYRIKAVNNQVADNPVFVTGGNHGSDGSGGGYPTAKPISIETFIDNKKVTSGTHHTNSPIVVKVVNQACAYNTINRDTGERRDVLREIITYTFYPNVYTVSIDMEALEPIEFYGHRGISMQRHNHNQFAYVPTDSNGQKKADEAFDFQSTSEGSNGDRIVQYNADNHLAVMFLDERIGVGDFELNTVDPRWFMSAGKTYSNTIEQGKYHPVATNEILTLSGGYHFGKALDMPGNGKAYHIIRGGKRVYCVDDFYARSGYVEVLPEDVNKEVKVIKNVGYTVDGFTTSKGLKFSKPSGAGTLMFEVI